METEKVGGQWLDWARIDKYLLIVLIAGILVFAVQAFFVSQIRYIGTSDPAHYAEAAENILSGKGFVLDYINEYYVKFDSITHPEEYGFPGVSILMAPFIFIFGKTPFAVKLPSMLIGAILVPLIVYLLGKEWFDRKVGFLAGISILIYPATFSLSFGGERDTIFAFFILLAAYLFARGLKEERWFYVMGVTLGFAYLVRQSALIIFPVLLLAYYIINKKISLKFLTGIGLGVLVMAPWLIRNYLIFGDPLFTVNRHIVAVLGYYGFFEPTAFKVYWGEAIKSAPSILGHLSSPDGRKIVLIRILNSIIDQASTYIIIAFAFLGTIFASGKKISKVMGAWIAFLVIAPALVFTTAKYFPTFPILTIKNLGTAMTASQAIMGNIVYFTLRIIPYAGMLATSFFVFSKDSKPNTIFLLLWGAFAVFLAFYWGNSIRYFLPIIALMFIFVWVGAEGLLQKISERLPQFKKDYVGLIIFILLAVFLAISIPLTIVGFVNPGATFPYKDDQMSLLTLNLADKINNVTEKDAVIMGCNVGVLHFYTGRKFLELPSDSFKKVIDVIKEYNVSYLTLLGCERRGVSSSFIKTILGEGTQLQPYERYASRGAPYELVRVPGLPQEYLYSVYKIQLSDFKAEGNKTAINITTTIY